MCVNVCAGMGFCTYIYIYIISLLLNINVCTCTYTHIHTHLNTRRYAYIDIYTYYTHMCIGTSVKDSYVYTPCMTHIRTIRRVSCHMDTSRTHIHHTSKPSKHQYMFCIQKHTFTTHIFLYKCIAHIRTHVVVVDGKGRRRSVLPR